MLAPIPPGSAVPWASERAPRRWGAKLLDVMVVLAMAALVTVRSPLAEHPSVRPYAQTATTTAVRGWHAGVGLVERSVAAVIERTR